jgi:hypothetical protein
MVWYKENHFFYKMFYNNIKMTKGVSNLSYKVIILDNYNKQK